ncbi:MAG: type II toxin-antitoxin system YafQ family toxin [bacterium]
MLKPAYTKQFQKDLEKARKRSKNIEKIKAVIVQLTHEKPLDKKYKNHKLIGNYKDRQECHIEPDWLLIYKITKEEIVFERTGTHSDLFK